VAPQVVECLEACVLEFRPHETAIGLRGFVRHPSQLFLDPFQPPGFGALPAQVDQHGDGVAEVRPAHKAALQQFLRFVDPAAELEQQGIHVQFAG
jgi:hypothetical protein